ncbi:hypothetical protein [Thermococcus thermotolerans]|uniref:hypothetical protein n=1 Tax=Thermococcus thermotolerans TaxID=2969672 RepID=UPI00215889AD|nr:hypothetical protein [Thermococcus thermotolerans]
MGVSVPAAFAVLLIAMLVSFGMLYVSSENAYSMVHEATDDYNRMVLRTKTSELELTGYNYTVGTGFYDITFNITNRGSTLSPVRWTYIFDGIVTTTSVVAPGREYLLPGEWTAVTVQNLQTDPTITYSLVVSTEVGCGLKIKWKWVGNTTNGSPQVVSSAWYCPVEG